MDQTVSKIFQKVLLKYIFHGAQLESGTDLSRGSGRGGGGGTGAVLQGEVSDEDNELGKRTTDLSTWALKQVLGEPVRVSKQNVVCKPIAYILTVSQQDAEGVIPGEEVGKSLFFLLKEGSNTREKPKNTAADRAYQSLAGPRTTFLV